MTDKLLISGISRPRTQAAVDRLKYFSGELLFFRVCMTLFFLAVMLFPSFLPAQSRDESMPLQVPIGSCIVKEIGCPTVLMAKDIDRPVSPASLTKILTCIMAIESGRLEENVLITQESTMVEPSKAGFKQGDEIRLVDLVKAAMVNSSNDAAFAIAIHLYGNVDSFVAAMNYKARRIGMKNSRFTNPAGFDKDIYAGNISTADDLLRLTEYAVRNPVFNQIARLDQAVFVEQTTRKVYSLKTHNKLLDKYPYAVGIKTGYTTKAGRCLIARAIKNNKDILLVMLNAKTDRWNVAVNLFDTAFSANRLNPEQFAQIFRSDSGAARVPMIASQAKSFKREDRLSKSGHLIMRGRAHHAIAESRTNRKSKREAIAGMKSRRGSKHHAFADLKVSRASKSHFIAGQYSSKRSKTHLVAGLKQGHKLRRREVVLSKPVRKNKRRVASSYLPEIMNNAALM